MAATSWRQEARQRARQMRAEGKSYEQIADALSGPERYASLVDVYEWVNPAKSTKQVDAWQMKHANGSDRIVAWMEKYRPDMLDAYFANRLDRDHATG